MEKEIGNVEAEIIAGHLLNEVTRLGKIENYKGIVHFIIHLCRGGLSLENLDEIEKQLFYSKTL